MQHLPELLGIAATIAVGAASPGPRVPVICARNGRYPLYQLVLERSLCINTAATGGNAGLLSLEE